MISIIISTRKNQTSLKNLIDNFSTTIGVEHEFIFIENDCKFSLCEAYNIGVKKAKFEYLCFVHDDILTKSISWGSRLISLMRSDSSIGMIGVAGTKFKSTYPSGWGQSPYLSQFNRGHIFSKLNGQPESHFDFDISLNHNNIDDVVCLDGVFLFTKKEVFHTCCFDEKMLTNFHGYDIDFSLQIYFQSYRIIVDRELLLIHHSGGNYSTQYTQANRLISKKWKAKLPAATNDTDLKYLTLIYLDWKNWYYFIITALKRKLHHL